ncbi:FAD-linked oxidoreductase-like protein [Tuber brumale]|nr:FAD-linked oxidoreductase-like protein [Tuber brumale]
MILLLFYHAPSLTSSSSRPLFSHFHDYHHQTLALPHPRHYFHLPLSPHYIYTALQLGSGQFMALYQTRMLLLTRTVPLARPSRVIRFASTISTPSSNVVITPPSPQQEASELSARSSVAPPPIAASDYPLARLSTTSLLRAMLLHSITASPILCKFGTKLIMMNLNSLKKGGLVKWGVDKTFYTQFCAGSTSTEITATISELRSLGLAGVILAYAREAEITDTAVSSESQSQQIKQWLDGSLKTIACVEPGDYVAIKYSGAGPSSLPLLNQHRPCFEFPELGDALLKICDSAKAKGVQILIDAEQASVQDGVHDWTLNLMRRYNTDGRAVVYNTYQMLDSYHSYSCYTYYLFLGIGYRC